MRSLLIKLRLDKTLNWGFRGKAPDYFVLPSIIICIGLLIIPSISLLGAQGNFGLGIIIGSPTGLSAKYLLTRNSAISVNAGWNLMDNVGVHITGDYQFLFPNVMKSEEGEVIKGLTPYLGVGGRFCVKDKDREDATEFHLGMRIGGGIEYMITPLGIFIEIYPVVDILPATKFDLEGGLGIRFFF